MKSHRKTLILNTERKHEMLNLTKTVGDTVAASGIVDGLVGVYCQHTTAALFVSEFQSALVEDLCQFLQRVVEDGLPYKHNSPEFSDCDRQNAASHLRSVL